MSAPDGRQERLDVEGDWKGLGEAAWMMPTRIYIDSLAGVSEAEREALHYLIEQAYEKGHEDESAEESALAGIGRQLLKEALTPPADVPAGPSTGRATLGERSLDDPRPAGTPTTTTDPLAP